MSGQELVAVEARAYRDESCYEPLPRLIGPFPDRATAVAYMFAQGPLWGEWSIIPLTAPECVR